MRVFQTVRRIENLWIMALPLILGPSAGLAQTALSIVPGSAIAGGAGSLSISINSTAGYAPAALEWTLTYSWSALTNLKVQTGAAATAASKSVVCTFASGSVRCLTWGLNDKTISNGVIATVTFSVSSHASVSTAAELTGLIAASSAGAAIKATGTGAVLPITSPNHISGLACTPSPLVTPGSAVCTVKFAAAASGSAIVALGLGTGSAKVTIPSSVTIPAGTASATFTLQAGAVSAATTAVIVATIGASTASLSLSLAP